MSSRSPSGSRVETQDERLARLEYLQNEFVAMVAHELREPLSSCIGYAELLLKRYDDLSKDEREEALQTISRTGRRMVSLVEDMLDVARIEGGALPLVMREIDLNDAVQSVLEEERRLLAGVRVEFERREIPFVKADPERLRQVLVNLMGNAAKFSSKGGVVVIRTAPANGEVLLSIEDQGIGIEQEDIPKLFGRFTRITQPGMKERIPGTGLGLYICKRIVEGHRGRIWAESRPGTGSTFFVSLPAAG